MTIRIQSTQEVRRSTRLNQPTGESTPEATLKVKEKAKVHFSSKGAIDTRKSSHTTLTDEEQELRRNVVEFYAKSIKYQNTNGTYKIRKIAKDSGIPKSTVFWIIKKMHLPELPVKIKEKSNVSFTHISEVDPSKEKIRKVFQAVEKLKNQRLKITTKRIAQKTGFERRIVRYWMERIGGLIEQGVTLKEVESYHRGQNHEGLLQLIEASEELEKPKGRDLQKTQQPC